MKTFFCFLLLLWMADATAFESSVASQFKAPHKDTPQNTVEQWHHQDATLWDYVQTHVPAVLEHTGAASFDEHLKGVQSVLRYWGAPDHVCFAGLLHSIYGTEGFQGFALPLSERPSIQKLIGNDAERLCWIFCMVDRSTVDQTVFDYDPNQTQFVFRARPELGRFEMTLTKDEWLDFIELTLADWLEQVEGAAAKPSAIFLWEIGQAYAYRRLAYHKMSEILSAERSRLSKVVPTMVRQVYGTEASATRDLVQPRTPPMCKAASDALDALRSAGEAIPNNLAPQVLHPEEEASCAQAQ